MDGRSEFIKGKVRSRTETGGRKQRDQKWIIAWTGQVLAVICYLHRTFDDFHQKESIFYRSDDRTCPEGKAGRSITPEELNSAVTKVPNL